jgi:hypothetical protein
MRRHVGDLPAFGLLLLPRGVPGNLLSETHKSQMQVASVNNATFVMDEKNLIILEQGHECLYNLQHNDYNNLVTVPGRRQQENFMHKIRNFHEGHSTVGEWQGRGMGTA